MKISELWLREWVNPSLTHEQLSEQLTLAGLEVESIDNVADEFTGVVVGKIIQIQPHPEAERLHICQVDVGQSQPISIVCGAQNIKEGMKVPAALVGASLPNHKKIMTTEIRGVISHGMLCSASELGLSEQGEGLLHLPQNAKVGENVWEFLQLTDHVFNISITPNRGDCLSLMGIAKEIAAITQTSVHIPNISTIKPSIDETLPVTIKNPACLRYVGRIIRDVKADIITPMWLQERLRRADIRCISPIVDIMNYVMLELGQPMHAFDLQEIDSEIQVRMAQNQEKLKLLDGQIVNLTPDILVIADQKKPLAIAGVMGGLESSVTLLTKNIFLESAWFQPESILATERRLGLGSESSYRFARGVDATLQKQAIERATDLILEIVGGQAGPVIEVAQEDLLPIPAKIMLRKERIDRILGLIIPENEVEAILQRLGFSISKNKGGWEISIPVRRTDIKLETDLIEEIIRLYGYQKLPVHPSYSLLQIHSRPENRMPITSLRRAFKDIGFHEIITYSFIDRKLQNLFDPLNVPKELLNPISQDMAVMRTSLWPGLVTTLIYNQNRQQARARLFEVGLRFLTKNETLIQENVISGLINGSVFPEQWGIPSREVDFFDLKGDLENALHFSGMAAKLTFKTGKHPALHPNQTAEIYRDDQYLGIIGNLHPIIIQKLDISGSVILFELLADPLSQSTYPLAQEISKFPEIRRDIAVLVKLTIPSQAIQDTIKDVTGDLLKDVNVFDVYQGKGIPKDQKSIALALTLQHASRTLRDEEVADILERVIVALKDKFAAELRG